MSDQAQILTTQQEQKLTEQINKLVNRCYFDLVILTVDSTDGRNINTFANDYFDNNGYGITAFTDYSIEYIFDELTSDMGDAEYYSAFQQYIKISEKILKEAKMNIPYDVSHDVPAPTNYRLAIAIGLLYGVVIAFIETHKMKSQLKSVKPLEMLKNMLIKMV